MDANKKTVMIAMSGGVDSSAACILLMEQGYSCMGATMRLFPKDKFSPSPVPAAPLSDDAADARAVAEKLGIPWQLFDFEEAFDQHVLAPFAAC